MNLCLNYYIEKGIDSWKHYELKTGEILKIINTNHNALFRGVVIHEYGKQTNFWCKHESYARVSLNKTHPEYKSLEKELGHWWVDYPWGYQDITRYLSLILQREAVSLEIWNDLNKALRELETVKMSFFRRNKYFSLEAWGQDLYSAFDSKCLYKIQMRVDEEKSQATFTLQGYGKTKTENITLTIDLTNNDTTELRKMRELVKSIEENMGLSQKNRFYIEAFLQGIEQLVLGNKWEICRTEQNGHLINLFNHEKNALVNRIRIYRGCDFHYMMELKEYHAEVYLNFKHAQIDEFLEKIGKLGVCYDDKDIVGGKYKLHICENKEITSEWLKFQKISQLVEMIEQADGAIGGKNGPLTVKRFGFKAISELIKSIQEVQSLDEKISYHLKEVLDEISTDKMPYLKLYSRKRKEVYRVDQILHPTCENSLFKDIKMWVGKREEGIIIKFYDREGSDSLLQELKKVVGVEKFDDDGITVQGEGKNARYKKNVRQIYCGIDSPNYMPRMAIAGYGLPHRSIWRDEFEWGYRRFIDVVRDLVDILKRHEQLDEINKEYLEAWLNYLEECGL